MREELLPAKKTIEDNAYSLWKGHGVDMGFLEKTLIEASNIILDMSENLDENDKVTTINYIRNALSDFERAYSRRDDYMLADCLIYEWREIIIIYADMN